jgi:3-methyl-2-oxobutanoate hydroxymethyltransferase
MSTSEIKTRRNSVQTIRGLKGKPEAFVALTSYTAPIARLADEVADLVLIGDSLGMVLYGMADTLGVTLDLMIPHAKAVMASTRRACVVFDMPFGTYQATPAQAFENAARVIKETGVQAVKIEGGAEMAETIAFLVQRGIPVLGHIGLRPQQVHVMGGYKVQGKDEAASQQLLADAKAVEAAGAFAMVIEGTMPQAANAITRDISIPTIGIGASAACDGQILVTEDLLGLTPPPRAKFVKTYASLHDESKTALGAFARDVKNRSFPSAENTYGQSSDVHSLPLPSAPVRGS